MAALHLLASSAAAQRVQFPSPTQPLQSLPPAPAVSSPYAAPASPYGYPGAAPAAPPATYGAPVAPPAATSPYAAPPTFAAPYQAPATTPLPPTYTPPAYTPPAYTPPAYTPPAYGTAPPPGAPYSPGAVGPPPAFDPYATGGISPPPPPTVPYNYTPPPAAGAYPPQSGSLFPAGSPFQWQPAPYSSNSETYWQKTQRFLQELSFEYTYLYGDHTDPFDFEINRAELASTFAFPMFYNIETPLLVTPGFAVNWLEGPMADPTAVMPRQPDLPPRLYDAYLDLAWYPRISEILGAELGVRTGVWSDFEDVNSDSIRLLGRGLVSLALTPQLDVLLGAVYLDRLEVKLLPAGGFYYRPTPDWDMYLVFPNPKVRRFMSSIGNSKWYWYLAGEYGGGSWSVERGADPTMAAPMASRISDQIDINDIRVSGGFEWETQTFIRGHIELGYVFDREIVFGSGDPASFKPDDTFMIRAGVDF